LSENQSTAETSSNPSHENEQKPISQNVAESAPEENPIGKVIKEDVAQMSFDIDEKLKKCQ
jgi:hypothetical protein